MTEAMQISSGSHGGMLIPFDMFRLSQLAAIYGELLASKARNILDARLVAIRHEAGNILLLRIEGHVTAEDAGEFWRSNADLALITSQAVPHRVLLYWAQPGPPGKRREGFLFAQRGQVIASDEASEDRGGGAEPQWPVTRLCEQMRISLDDLGQGFPGSPLVEIPLVDAGAVNDQELLMTLVGRSGGGIDAEEDEGEAPPAAAAPARPARGAAPAPAAKPGAARPPATTTPPRLSVDDDAKRRATEAAAEAAEQKRKAEALQASLAYVIDDLGVINTPSAGLGEPDLLRPLIIAEIRGDLPAGLPSELAERLQGKRSDIAVPVEFLSEVFVENTPLSRPTFQERATAVELGGKRLLVMEVLAPRLGYGSLVSTGSKHAFVSRKPEQTMPIEVLLRILDGQG
ncbi:MAG TPA: hypothetical protein VG755_04680 [Nannocystaceae bacterium]|nr:hypothetical protein [Nannocystaceae bacterium]